MAFVDSIAGNFTSRLWANPLVGAASVFAGGAAAFAAVDTYATTEGSASTRSDEAATSALTYGTVGMVAAGGVAVAATHFGPARLAESAAKGGIAVSSGVQNYGKGLVTELKSPGGWKTALRRPSISGGIGALVGAYVGNRESDGSTAGTVTGAVVGTGVGVAANRAFKASQVWGKWNGATRLGSILAASAVIGGAIKLAHGNGDPERLDRAEPEDTGYSDTGVRDRMSRIGAAGDLVFGLHRQR